MSLRQSEDLCRGNNRRILFLFYGLGVWALGPRLPSDEGWRT